jgi:S-adenosylmethionine:tRNA ribosyltransferase-isomerase
MDANENDLVLSDFLYDLPENRIARYPLEKRENSKQLVYKYGRIFHDGFSHLPGHLQPGDLLVFNETKVIKARLLFQKSTGGVVEVFCLHPTQNLDPSESLSSKSGIEWLCMIKGGKRWKNEIIKNAFTTSNGTVVELRAEQISKSELGSVIRFEWSDDAFCFADILFFAGAVPIPPYLKRAAEELDETRYQTVFAAVAGSVAAPTAGLHFTDEILNELNEKGIETCKLILHVGAGTFRPIQTENIAEHQMHDESFIVSEACLMKLKSATGRIIPVGTTAMRSLESIFQLAMKHQTAQRWNGLLKQNEVYYLHETRGTLLDRLQKFARQEGGLLKGQTGIMIKPGYAFGFCGGLITNFHQPGSTLILLVAAFVGSQWKEIYHQALANDYRFLSYGDSSLLLP